MICNVKDFGAVGDGVNDDSIPIQKALLGGRREVYIPPGNYRIRHTLRVDSFTTIRAAEQARLFVCGETVHGPDDFLLTNRDFVSGNAAIHISGGVWDGNKTGRTNVKDPDLFNLNACSGTVLNFHNVRDLELSGLTVADSVVYFIRLCLLDGFVIRDIDFRSSVIENNQDGLHFNGWVRNGLIENIRAVTPGETNDDLIALNADDAMNRLENNGMVCGPIENLVFRNLCAENCHTAIRMLSFISPIRNLRFEHVVTGCRCFALNLDAARYCRTPLFQDQDFPNGVGWIEDVEIDGLRVWWSTPGSRKALIDCETRVRNFTIRNWQRDTARDCAPEVATLVVDKTPGLRARALADGQTVAEQVSGPGPMTLSLPFDELHLN